MTKGNRGKEKPTMVGPQEWYQAAMVVYMSVILALGKLRQEDCHEVETSLRPELEFKISHSY